jgi:hypothetical protein
MGGITSDEPTNVIFAAILDSRPIAACQITTSDATDSLWFVRILVMALQATVTVILRKTVICALAR